MIKLAAALPLVILSLVCTSVLAAGVSQAGDEKHWFYMVKTKPSNPAREAEFNIWYDQVDIPDVLEVPGFMRARRGIGQDFPEFPSVNLKGDDGNYVALYNIETDDIDKSIIDLYVAARKMGAMGRLTNDLKVVEANYYRRAAPPFEVSAAGSPDWQNYLFVRKILCCRDAVARERLLDWYAKTLLPKMAQAKGLVRANLYELYRIMEVLTVGPEEIPHFLAVYEIEAESPRQAIADIFRAVDKLKEAADVSKLYREGDGAVYLQTSDVKSKYWPVFKDNSLSINRARRYP